MKYLLFNIFIIIILINSYLFASSLSLFIPEYDTCGNISVSGYVNNITRMTWDWGDGTIRDSFFPALHHYSSNGSYIMEVTAYDPTGETQSETISIVIDNAENIDCENMVPVVLLLDAPEYDTCGNVSVSGYVDSYGVGDVTHLTWDWGDGTVRDSWFPALHHYSDNGTYSVQVTAHHTTGKTKIESILAFVSNAENQGFNYTFLPHPSLVCLRDGHITETLRIDIRDENGIPIPPNEIEILFTSHNPELVQVDKFGVITSIGFGETEIEVTAYTIGKKAKVKVIAGHFRIEPPALLLSVKDEPTGHLTVNAANADGTPIDLTKYNIEFSGGNHVANVDNNGIVTALSPPQFWEETPYLKAFLDRMPSNNNAFIRVTSTSLGLTMKDFPGKHTIFRLASQVGSYPYELLIKNLQAVNVADSAFLIMKKLTDTIPPTGDLLFLVMDPGYDADGTVPCGLSGNPVRLGVAVDNENSCLGGTDFLQWGIIFHEMGHNFMASLESFYDLISGLPNNNTYNEGMATILGLYAIDTIIKNPFLYGFTEATTENLSRKEISLTPNHAREVYYNSLSSYETDPDYSQKFNADILDAIMMKLHDENGMSFLYRFFSVFLPADRPLDNINLSSEGQRLAFWVAACSAAAHQDLRERFQNKWGFPIDEVYYNKIYPNVKKRVSLRDPIAYAGSDRKIDLGESIIIDDAYVFDWENDPLFINWQIIAQPSDSAATFSDSTALHPIFYPDKSGEYILSLTVCDEIITGIPDTVIILVQDINCTYSINPMNTSYPAKGGIGTINITTQDGCSWRAMTDVGWIAFTSLSNSTGNGIVEYTVSKNTDNISRKGNITIADQTHTVIVSPLEELCDGDLNGDSIVTPVDALIAFECFLGFGSCPNCADINKDGAFTAADAFCIFEKYLGLPNCLD